MALFRGLFVRRDAGGLGTQPSEARRSAGALLTPADAFGARAGVLPGPGTPGAVTGTATWEYSVAAGYYVTQRSDADGPFLYGSDGPTLTPAVAAAPGSGSRWDLIWVQHQDPDQGAAASTPVYGVTSGAASASPAKPYADVPAGAFVLAEAQVSAGATSTQHANVTISPVFTWTALRGAPVPVRTAAERDAAALFVGAQVARLDLDGVVQEWTGTAWRTLAPTVVVGSDAGFPLAGSATTSAVVIDQFTLPARGFACHAEFTGTYWISNTQVSDADVVLKLNGSVVARARSQFSGGISLSVSHALVAASSAAQVYTVEIQRISGTGIVTNSLSGGLSRGQAKSIPT